MGVILQLSSIMSVAVRVPRSSYRLARRLLLAASARPPRQMRRWSLFCPRFSSAPFPSV